MTLGITRYNSIGQRVALVRRSVKVVGYLSASTASRDPTPTASKFSFSHVLYYFGGLIAIGALSIFCRLRL